MQADIVAMVRSSRRYRLHRKVDFVMKAGRIYRHQAIDVFQS